MTELDTASKDYDATLETAPTRPKSPKSCGFGGQSPSLLECVS